MRRMVVEHRVFFRWLLALVAGTLHVAAAVAGDVQGGQDSPLLTRFTGSTLVGHSHADWAQATFPLAREMAPGDNQAFA